MEKIKKTAEERPEEIIATQKEEIFRLQSVLDNLPGSIYWKDKNGVYLGRNKCSADIIKKIGFEEDIRSYALGKTDHDIFPQDVADWYRKNDVLVMESKKEMTVEEPIFLPNRKKLTRLSSKRPLLDREGNIVGVIGNTVDITQLKEIEAELRRAKEEAEQASNAKIGFIRNIEHDIRTPFNGVWAMANYLWQQETDPQKKEYLGDITQCAQELLDYCNDILDFSNIESGSFPKVNNPFNLAVLLDKIVKTQTPAVKQKKLELKIKYDKTIPSDIIGDDYRLYRILINLVSNAVKFTQEGYIHCDVALIKQHQHELLIRFMITDTGNGIPEDKRGYIFQMFSRLTPSTMGLYKGLGLGLRIVKQFIEEMEGKIEFESQVNKGTTFICHLPFKIVPPH